MQTDVQYKFVFPSEEMAITFSHTFRSANRDYSDEYLSIDDNPSEEDGEFVLWATLYSTYSMYEKHQFGTDDPDNGECDHDPEAVELPAGYFVRRYKIVRLSGASTHTPYMTYTEEWV